MTPDEAKHYVAQGIAHSILDDVHDAWCLYPEIGEDDWVDIQKIVLAKIPVARPELFNEAYLILAERALSDG